MQRREVVENPEPAPLRRDDEILAVHLDVGDRQRSACSGWNGCQCAAVVERDVHPELGAGVEQPFAVRIFADDARGRVGGNAVLARRSAASSVFP